MKVNVLPRGEHLGSRRDRFVGCAAWRANAEWLGTVPGGKAAGWDWSCPSPPGGTAQVDQGHVESGRMYSSASDTGMCKQPQRPPQPPIQSAGWVGDICRELSWGDFEEPGHIGPDGGSTGEERDVTKAQRNSSAPRLPSSFI